MNPPLVREDEAVAEAIGVNAFRHKLLAFICSSSFAGMTGGVFAYYHVSFYPAFGFSPLWTFDPLLITYLGGVGTVGGPLIGAVVFLSLREALALRLGELHLLIFGLLFVAVGCWCCPADLWRLPVSFGQFGGHTGGRGMDENYRRIARPVGNVVMR